jgi:hypothetical protein
MRGRDVTDRAPAGRRGVTERPPIFHGFHGSPPRNQRGELNAARRDVDNVGRDAHIRYPSYRLEV